MTADEICIHGNKNVKAKDVQLFAAAFVAMVATITDNNILIFSQLDLLVSLLLLLFSLSGAG